MRCECMHEFGAPLVHEDRSDPTPTGTEVLVKITAAGLCHSDLHIHSGNYDLGHGRKLEFASRGLELPVILGHEIAGEIVATGAEVKGLDTNSTYVVFPWQGCGECRKCLEGAENFCLKPRNLGFHTDGGFASMIKVKHPRYLFDIGDMDPAIAAPLACSGLTAFSALKKVEDTIAETPLVIIGAGGLGLMCVGLVQALGGLPPVVVDIDPAKRAAALEAGAGAVIDGKAEDAMAQIQAAVGAPIPSVIDFVAAPATAGMSFDMVSKGGKVILVGLFGGASDWPLPMFPLKAVSVIGSVVGSLPEFAELIDLARAGKVQPLQTTRYALEEANDAMHELEEGRIVGRAVLVP
ncbi:alcohol dehydrogenase [Celeribacter litoreus]|uniref:alcohol dehydrogenase n=1 Tax=Celeribacter litoreus TaxID=2876714 RepID=UPI001CC95D3D|nr:alcohol dehydrogenase [Celeribacter litoreus]MCA0043407.1 alcohol dehydrogenase [Celeribacter litoreus]